MNDVRLNDQLGDFPVTDLDMDFGTIVVFMSSNASENVEFGLEMLHLTETPGGFRIPGKFLLK